MKTIELRLSSEIVKMQNADESVPKKKQKLLHRSGKWWKLLFGHSWRYTRKLARKRKVHNRDILLNSIRQDEERNLKKKITFKEKEKKKNKIIKFEVDSVHGDSAPSFATVKYWIGEFKPAIATHSNNIEKVYQIVLDDQRD